MISLLPYQDPIPVSPLGAFLWHAHCSTWRYAVWLFERGLILVDAALPAYEIVELPSPTVLSGHGWKVVAVGPRGDWVVSSMPGEACRPAVVRLGGREFGLSWNDLYSWTRLDGGGIEAVIAVIPTYEHFWGALLGREMAKYQWGKWPSGAFPLRNQATLHLQRAFGLEFGEGGDRVLDVHPTRDDLVVVRSVTGQKFVASQRGGILRELYPGQVYSWTRLGHALILDTWGFLGSSAPGSSTKNLGVFQTPAPPWEDAWGHVWALREDHLALHFRHPCRFTTCPKGHVQLNPGC